MHISTLAISYLSAVLSLRDTGLEHERRLIKPFGTLPSVINELCYMSYHELLEGWKRYIFTDSWQKGDREECCTYLLAWDYTVVKHGAHSFEQRIRHTASSPRLVGKYYRQTLLRQSFPEQKFRLQSSPPGLLTRAVWSRPHDTQLP